MKVEIPDKLYEDLKKEAKKGDFSSADELIVFALGEMVRVNNEDDEADAKARLKSLGYL